MIFSDHKYTYERDERGNPTRMVNPLGHTTVMEHDERGLITRMLEPNQLEILYEYNQNGLLETMTEIPPEDSPGNTRITRYTYFPTGLIQSMTTPDLITYTFQYDERSRSLGYTDNLGQSMRYTYDKYGNIVQMDVSNSDQSLATTQSNDYDSRNRFIRMTRPHIGALNSKDKGVKY